MKKFINEIKVEQIEGIYVPIFSCKYHAEYFFIGERIVTETSGKGRTTIKRVKVQDEGEKIGSNTIPSKKYIEELGINELCKKTEEIINSKNFELIKAEEYKWNFKGSILSFDYSPEEIKKIFEDMIAEQIKKEIKSKYGLNEIKVLSCNVKITELIPIYVPLWIVSYSFKDSIYSISFFGKDGSQLVAIEPMFKTQRILSVFLSSLFTIFFTILIASLFLSNFITFLLSELGDFGLFLLIIPLFLLVGAFYFMRKAFKGERIER